MPVREAERRLEADLDAETAPPQAEAPATKFSAEGDLPAVAEDVKEAPSASDLAFAQPQGDISFLDLGMHDVDDYQQECVAAGKPEKWDDSYVRGHTEAKQFTHGRNAMTWTLNKYQSASQAVKDFIAGKTVADYRVIAVARDLDELRDDLGDIKFDQLFGSKDEEQDSSIPHEHRLQINSAMYTTPFVDQMKAIAAEADQASNVEDPIPPPVVEQRDDGKPKQSDIAEDPVIVAEDLGRQPERELL